MAVLEEAAAEEAVTGPGHAHWLRTARELADDLATDAAVREQAGKAPLDEVQRLREAGLLTLLAPAPHGGGGDWRTAYAVVRTVAAADGAVGLLLGSHYFLSRCAHFFARPALASRIERRSAAGRWCWGGGIPSGEPPLRLDRAGRGFRLEGRLDHVHGVRAADRLLVRAARAGSDEPLAVMVDPAHPGVVCGGGGDTFGQRLTGGAGVEFDAVPVASDAVLGSLSADEGVLSPFAALAAPTARLVSVQFCLGVAEGLLAEAREFSMSGGTASGGTVSGSAGRASDGALRDPYALTAYGELAVTGRAAAALADQAVDALARGLGRGEDLDDEECAEISVLAGAAEAAASRAAQEITARALDAIGAPAATARNGFDRFWRDVRTHTLREPVAQRLCEVGDYVLNGAHPAFTLPA